jgi:eukaryotic-like serine/threonine-protein kinase
VPPARTEFSTIVNDRRHFFESVARIGRQTASALAHAHQRGVIHRDIKPSNLLLDAAGTVWVTDFGLAKTEEEDLTRTGDILGTIRYMSPERFQGRSDARGDIYALGMTLRELLVLRPAFESTDRAKLVAMIASEEPIRPRVIDPRIPSDLETIVLKAIAKEPERRYQTAQEMAEDLRCFLDGEPIKARRVGTLGRARLWCRRNPALAGLYGVLFAVAISTSFAAVYFNSLLRQSERDRKDKDEAEQRAVEELFTSLVAQADATRSSRKIGQRFETLETIKKAMALARGRNLPIEGLDRLRTIAIAALALPDIQEIDTWQPLGDQFTGKFQTDADHRLVALCLRNEVVVCRMVDHQEVARVRYPAEEVSLTPDGRFLLAIITHRFCVWDISSPKPKLVVTETEQEGVACHPNSRHIMVGRPNRTLELIDLFQQEPDIIWQAPAQTRAVPLAYDPSGKRLVVSLDSVAHIIDVTNPHEPIQQLFHSGQCENACWHPSGRYVAVVEFSRAIEICDVESLKPVGAPLEGTVNSGIDLTFTPDGEFLVSWGWEGKFRVWQFRTGKLLLQHPDAGRVSFSQDGECLFGAGRSLVRAIFRTGTEHRVFGTSSRYTAGTDIFGGSIHPDGRLLAVASTVGIHFWDLMTGEDVKFVPLQPVYTVGFPSPDELVIQSDDALAVCSLQIDKNRSLFRIGPPKTINRGSYAAITYTIDGKHIAQPMYRDAGVSLFLRKGDEWTPQPFASRVITNKAVISPEGTLLATGSYRNNVKTRVWDTAEGRQLAEYNTVSSPALAFSPNNKWLAMGSSEICQIVPVGDWLHGIPLEERFDGEFCFSPGSDFLAVGTRSGAIQWFDTATGRKLVRFESQTPDRASSLVFTPDGTRLVAICNESKAIHVWNLQLIHKELSDLGLDWDPAPFAAATEDDKRPIPRLRVDFEIEPKE